MRLPRPRQYHEKTRRYEGLTIHDFRRSAVINLTRAGVPRGIAMSITGHKTEHVFERYNITDTADIREALIKVGKYASKKIGTNRYSQRAALLVQKS